MIHIEGLQYTYPGAAEPVIRGMNLSIEAGEIFGFLGPSGAGKSTTQKVLTGGAKGYDGRVIVLGQEMRKASSAYYEQIGVAFEFPNFYSRFTALENLELFRSLYKGPTEDPMKLLQRAGLADSARMRVDAYSKGMKMRLNFCRALLNRPRLLFLDEPTSGLDPANAKRMKDWMLEQKAQGTTILITTHNMHVAEEVCDRVAFIVDGEIKLIDAPRQLKLRSGQRTVKVEYREGTALAMKEFALEGLGSEASFMELLRTRPIETIHTMEATLEDIFIAVTGRALS